MTILSIKEVSKTFGGVRALNKVNLEIAKGEIHCLAGENGSGKSTLIKVISGVHFPDSGSIILDGKIFSHLTPIQAINNGVQVIYQDFSVFPNLTVLENLAINAEVERGKKLISWQNMRRTAEAALEKIGVNIDIYEKVSRLSVAEKQLVAIARALMSEAKLIVMDEATTALTAREVDTLFKIILDLKENGIATLFVSHKLEEVFRISENFTIIRNGSTVLEARPDELDYPSFTKYMTGKTINTSISTTRKNSDDPVIRVAGLSSHNDAFSDINFSVSSGEILGIIGRLGSGRTELARALFGDFKISQGTVEIFGTPVILKNVRDAIRHGIAYVPEDRLTEGLFLERSISQNIMVTSFDKLRKIFGLFSRKKMRMNARDWVKELKIATPEPEYPVSTLSGGNQQRVVLAKWLATDPKIMILNGPTVGVDIGSKHEIHQILSDLADKGMAIILVSDDIPEIIQNCNKILVMNAGQIVRQVISTDVTEAGLADLISENIIARAA